MKKPIILNNETSRRSEDMANSENLSVAESFLWVCPRLSLRLSGARVRRPGRSVAW